MLLGLCCPLSWAAASFVFEKKKERILKEKKSGFFRRYFGKPLLRKKTPAHFVILKAVWMLGPFSACRTTAALQHCSYEPFPLPGWLLAAVWCIASFPAGCLFLPAQ